MTQVAIKPQVCNTAL